MFVFVVLVLFVLDVVVFFIVMFVMDAVMSNVLLSLEAFFNGAVERSRTPVLLITKENFL